MKGLIGLAAVILLGGFALMTWNANEWSRDHGQYIGLAFDKPGKAGELNMHVVVQEGLLMTEPPDVSENGAVLYNEWVDDHFELTDGAGTRVPLRRIAHTRLISEREAMNVEFFLEGRLKAGTSYTLDYIPVRAGPKTYRLEFTAPNAAKGFARENFEPA